MKTAIESITEVYEAGKEHPGLYEVPDRILVAAMVQLAQDVENFKKSNPVASGYQEEIPPPRIR